MVRKMSSAFKTTPIVPLHYMMAIPPLPLSIKKLTAVFRLRIQRLPPSSLICTITLTNPSADWHLSLNPPTALTQLLLVFLPPFYLPKPLYDTNWTHPQFRDHSAYKLTTKTKEATKLLILQPSPDIFHLFIHILTIPSPPFTASYLLFRGQSLVHSGAVSDPSHLCALFLALCNGLTYASLSNHICIFLPDLSLSPFSNFTSTPFLTYPTLYDQFSLPSLMRTTAIMLTPTGTPSSGLDSRAQQESTPSWRSTKPSPFHSLPLLSSPLKPSSFVTGRTLMTSFAVMPNTGNLLSVLTATLPLSTLALSHVSIAGRHLPLSNSPSTTPSPLPTPTFFAPKPGTIPSARSTPTTSHHPHRSWNNNDSIASCAISMIHAPTDPPLFPHLPIYHEHPSHDLSGLAREEFDSGLARVGHSGGTQQIMFCSGAPLYLHPDAGSSELVPLTLMSLAPSTALSSLVTSNAPPIVFFALCPPIQTLLDW